MKKEKKESPKIKNPKIKMMSPSKLVPYDKNPRVNEGAVEAVAKSIDVHGFNQPVVTDQNFRICVGHTRTLAAKALGLKKIPVLVKEMSEAQFISYNIADNKTSELSDWDEDLLKDLVLDLSELDAGLAMDLPGFELDEIEDLLSEDDEPEPKEKKPKTKRSSTDATKMIFACTGKEAMDIDSKLDGIIREQDLMNQTEALLFALKNFKGNTKTKRRLRPIDVLESKGVQ